MDQTRKQARLEFAAHARLADRHRRRRRAGAHQDARPRRRGAGGRAGRWRTARARHIGRVRQDADPVRPAHRQLPGHQAQVRRHAARGRVGQVGRLLRGLGRRRGLRRAPGRGQPGQVRTAPRPTSTPPPRTSRSTAASGSRGSTRPTSTSSGPSRPSSSWATRRTTGSCWHSASGSEVPGPFRLRPGPAGDLCDVRQRDESRRIRARPRPALPRPAAARGRRRRRRRSPIPALADRLHARVGLAGRHRRRCAAPGTPPATSPRSVGSTTWPSSPRPRCPSRRPASSSASASAACWPCTSRRRRAGGRGRRASAHRPTSRR